MPLKAQIKTELDEIKKVQKQEADFEKAWTKITLKPAQLPTGKNLKDISPDDLANALALRSMAAELLDYNGQYSLANDFVEKSGEYCLAAPENHAQNRQPSSWQPRADEAANLGGASGRSLQIPRRRLRRCALDVYCL